MKKYENFNHISEFDIQGYSGLESEYLTNFLKCYERNYPITASCCGITYPTAEYYIKRSPSTIFVLEHVISGKGYVIVNGKKHVVTAGDSYLLKPTENCEYYADKTNPFHKLWINFKGSFAQEIVSQYKLHDTVYNNVNLYPIFQKLFRLVDESNDLDEIHIDLSCIITEMLLTLAKNKGNKKSISENAFKIKNILDKCVYQIFSLDEIAQELFISKIEVIRSFKKAFDVTPYQYLLNLKINSAKIMLENSNDTITEISSKLAFSTPYHFSDIFKKKIGISPSEYRKKYLEKIFK